MADIHNTAFKVPNTVNDLNAWANQHTHGKIPEILPMPSSPEEIKSFEDTLALLLNAIYFKADWQVPFYGTATQHQSFYLASGQTEQVQMMKRTNSFGYLPPNLPDFNNPFTMVNLPYGRDGLLSMTILLPNADTSLNQLYQSLSGIDLKHLFASTSSAYGTLSLPKFKQSNSYDLIPALQKLGMVQAFDPGQADFSKMAKPRNPDDKFALAQVLQKTTVEVNEEGTEAAAVTLVQVSATPEASPTPMNQINIVVDHPFLYLIRDTETGQILFMGALSDPNQP
jgi:serpin B